MKNRSLAVLAMLVLFGSIASAQAPSGRIVFPTAGVVTTGGDTLTVFGRFFVLGITDASNFNDPHPSLVIELGVGPDGSDPSVNPAGWVFQAAAPNPGWFGPQEDEYFADLVSPASAGSYDYAFRFSLDFGITFTYCDGGALGSADGYQVANAGDLTVSNSGACIGVTANYCTAGTSANGCSALISGTGTPSATAASGFDLVATGVEGSKDGLFFFSTNGRQANAWGNGTSYQCVVPPVVRAGLLTGTGTPGLCDGSLSVDLNALWTAKPAKNPGPGAVAQAQLWYRDPTNTSNQTTSLSNALEFNVCP